MQGQEPSWKIRSRPCPFYAQGKCLFWKNCSFLHDKNTPTLINITSPDDDTVHRVDLNANSTMSPQLASLSDPPEIPFDTTFPHVDDENSISDEASPDTDDSESEGSPTIRKQLLPAPSEKYDAKTGTRPSRDSVATVKGDLQGFESMSNRTSRSRSAFIKFNAQPHRENARRTSRPVFKDTSKDSLKEIKLLPPFTDSSGLRTSSSAVTSAQELEVPSFGDLQMRSKILLADAASSSLLANRLAKSREHPPPKPSIPDGADYEDHSMSFSVDAFYASYHESNTAPASPSVDSVSKMESPERASPTSQVGTQTPSWLRPLRLPSVVTPQTELQSSASLDSNQFTHDAFKSRSHSPLSTHSSVSSEPLYESPVTLESPKGLYRCCSSSSNNLPTNSPHTIVLSDHSHSGSVSPLILSRKSSIDIDTSYFPPPPVSPESNAHRSFSSQASNSLSELIGCSPRKRSVVSRMRSTMSRDGERDPISDATSRNERATTPAEQFQSALERRAKRMRESSRLMSSSELQNSIIGSSSALYPHNSPPNSTLLPEFSRSLSWSAFPQAPFSDSLLMQQVQSSPPRRSPHLLSPRALLTASPTVHGDTQIARHPSPDLSSRPHLLFAIASDQPAEVERLLSSGEASANETLGNDVGLLEFTVTNEGLKNKTEMVKTLLKYGAEPGPLVEMAAGAPVVCNGSATSQSPVLAKRAEEAMNPAMKYYLARPKSLDIGSKPALEALQNSSFAPLARARFDIIGQDRALDELYRVLGVYSQRRGRNALVILLCGASGHGKSLLAQKVGALLDAPTHTINMTALRSQHDLWQCLSTGMDDASPDLDLSEFLVKNQGKRCVIVLDEIEKVDDTKSLNPLLLPWDIGRCSLEQKTHTDTSKVIWIATSNLGQQLIADHVAAWGHPDSPPTRTEYIELATVVRRRIADVLGASLLSRITTVLPFLPFTEVEKIAIGSEAALSHAAFLNASLSSTEIEVLAKRAVKDINYVEEEGARSLQRIVEIHLSMKT